MTRAMKALNVAQISSNNSQYVFVVWLQMCRYFPATVYGTVCTHENSTHSPVKASDITSKCIDSVYDDVIEALD